MDAPPISRKLDNGEEQNVENAAASIHDICKTRGSGEDDDNSLFRLPNGQVITSKNTIQSHVEVLANEDDHVIVNDVNDSQNDNHNGMFQLPNGQVITAKNTIPSNDNHDDSGRRRRRQDRDGTNHAAPLSARHRAERHHSSNNKRNEVEAVPIIVNAWHPQQQPQPPTPADGLVDGAAATHNSPTNAVDPVSDGNNIATTSTGSDGATGRTADSGAGTNKFKKLGTRLALVVLVLTVTVLITLQLSASKSSGASTAPATVPSLPISSLRSVAPTVQFGTAPIATAISPMPLTIVVPSPTLAPSFQSPLPASSSQSPPPSTLEPSLLPALAIPSTEIQLPESTMAPSVEVVTPSQRATLLTKYINEIKLSNGTLAVPTSFTPFDASTSTSSEQAALSWLVYDDPLQLWPPNGNTNDATLQFRLQQRYALLTLLLQFSDFNATSSSNECQWLPFAVTCVASTELGADVVTEIDFIGYLTAPGSTLSSDLGLLTNLVSFGVASAGLTGRLPSSLGMSKWTKLTYFATYDNRLTGSIPSSLGMTWTNLTFFDVSGNGLTGSLSPSLGATWTNLARFDVSYNALTGSLPPTMGMSWTNLTRFDVESNDLTGTIPNDMASHWSTLESAYFESNTFVGSIPSGLCTVGTLTWLSADCSTEVTCACCDACCSDATGSCE